MKRPTEEEIKQSEKFMEKVNACCKELQDKGLINKKRRQKYILFIGIPISLIVVTYGFYLLLSPLHLSTDKLIMTITLLFLSGAVTGSSPVWLVRIFPSLEKFFVGGDDDGEL